VVRDAARVICYLCFLNEARHSCILIMLQYLIYIICCLLIIGFIYIIYRFMIKRPLAHPELLSKPFPGEYRQILEKRVRYYNTLNAKQKEEFESRILKFLAEKKIAGVDTPVSVEDTILVAASAIIPMFAFPYYNYPDVDEIILYPNSFDREFHTGSESRERNVLGMVGNGYLNGHVLLSRPDLEAAFDGTRHKSNVGIHEFIHLIDKADGAVDGVPEVLFEHSFALPWLKEVRKEINKIKRGRSDINPYALTNEAEFLAVVGEYFFDDPEKMKSRHPELYAYLVNIFKQHPGNV
jgi:Mlc titration factor MtfA (ptsG expression regulator)